MYKYMNMNPKGNNIDDCTIRAISCATGKSWDYVYEHLSDIAQAEGTMMDNKYFIIDYLDRRYKRLPYSKGTVGQIARKYKDNILIISMKGHLTCSKYGKIYDTFDPSERKVEYAWIVE